MSVYRRRGQETYSYDFQVSGARFSGDTGATSKREALSIQAVERAKAKELAKAGQLSAGRNMTVGDAVVKYMLEVGQYHTQALTTLKSLEWLEAHLGKGTRLVDVDDAAVARLVAMRRSDTRQVGKLENRTKKVGPATVNRTCTEPLRKVITRARKVWKVPVQEIDWSTHMLSEPKERVREASVGEEAAIMAELDRGYDEAFRFAMLNGVRRIEILRLRWHHVNFFARTFTVIGKGGKERSIPMSQETYDLLWSLRGRHPEVVFCFQAARTRKHGGRLLVRGEWYPMTESGLKSAARRGIAGAGVVNFRLHDTRHTTATRVLRKSNLRVVQQLLGHEDVATTTKYAHALAEDVRAALDAASPTKSPTDESGSAANELKDQGKTA